VSEYVPELSAEEFELVRAFRAYLDHDLLEDLDGHQRSQWLVALAARALERLGGSATSRELHDALGGQLRRREINQTLFRRPDLFHRGGWDGGWRLRRPE
jgi:hypothetical protein